MGLLDNTTQKDYYKGYGVEGTEVFGGYQFISLQELIAQFEVAYVGKNKIIPKINKTDIQFHAMRALQEFSFDTLKSIKSQQIDLPASLVMPLPHDYVNYTKLSWVDTAGIKHLIYPTKHTNNPFQIRQDDGGGYEFPANVELALDGDYGSSGLLSQTPWNLVSPNSTNPNLTSTTFGNLGPTIDGGTLKFAYHTINGLNGYNNGIVYAVWQEIDTSDKSYLTLSADGVADTVAWDQVLTTQGSVPLTKDQIGVLRVGLSTSPPDESHWNNLNNMSSGGEVHTSKNLNPDMFDLTTTEDESSYLEWRGPAAAGSTTATKELNNIEVGKVDKVYLIIVSYVEHSLHANAAITSVWSTGTPTLQNSIDNVSLKSSQALSYLTPKVGNETESSTWNNYKSTTPSENNNDDYEDDVYWPIDGERYGLEPSHAQTNGSFFIDNRLGRIHFSSNISGKTVILDYISDSLGTEEEMQVHKFAEEAMYKWIAYAILSTSSLPIHQQLAPRFKKEKFAETRKAKLRLSNVKLEELTQILRGKSKWIKH
tara:strand:- start:1791 stop:3407 length:1617 start_codon:yes stop_codon:yes gene_type:complete